jgi:hypothetical protein
MAEIAAYVKTHPKVERLFLSGNNLGLAGAKHLCALLLHPSLRLVRLGNKQRERERERDVWAEEKEVLRSWPRRSLELLLGASPIMALAAA